MPGMDKQIEELAWSWVKYVTFETIQAVAPLNLWVWLGNPWQCVHLEFVGSIPNRKFPILVDAHSN